MKWNLQYLSEHMGNGKLTVYQTRDHCEKFKYFDEKKKVDGFVPPMKQVQMTFKEFHESLKCQPRGLRLGDKILIKVKKKKFVFFNFYFHCYCYSVDSLVDCFCMSLSDNIEDVVATLIEF